MKLSAKDLKAINWYITEHGLKPQLSTPPLMYFTARDTGRPHTASLSAIHDEYNSWNDEDKKQRAREKRIKNASANARPRLYS